MALVLKDRVKQTASNPGTGTVTLGTTPTGFQSFSAIGNGNTTYFAIVDPVSGDWEVNYGTYTSSGTTLSRNATPLSSSNGGALVNFTGTTLDVFCTYPSENAVWRDTSGTVVQQSFGAITATSAALTTGTVSTTPTANTDIANKQYVDTISTSGVHYHDPVYVEVPNTFGNLNATYNNGASGVGATLTNAGTQAAFTADGISVPLNSRVLVYNQTNAAQNGVYTLTTVGSGSTNWVLTRATDADTYSPFSPNSLGQGDAFFVTNGLTGAGETYICNTVGTITFGTTAITFAQISDSTLYTAGTGLTLTGTEFSITNTGVTANTYGSASIVPVITVNAQGQATGITNANIAISGSAVSGNISGSAGSVANALTAGSYLTSAGTFDGSAARTFAVDATSANTASKVVARDASGNFSAGTITATLSGAATSATTATNIAGGAANQIPYNTAAGTTSFITAPTTASTYLGWNGSAFTYSAISTPNAVTFNNGGTGDASGTTFNGSVARTISYNTVGAPSISGTNATGTWGISISGNAATATSATSATSATTATNLAGGSAGTIPYQSAAGTTVQLAAGTSGQVLQSNGAAAPSWVAATAAANNGTLTMAVSGTGLSGSQTFTANQATNATFTVTSNATNANTASTIVARDASGNFSAGTITAALSGNATTATSATSATTATNVAGGVAGAIHYQSAVGTTGFSAAGTSGQVLTSSGTTAPTWTTATSANTASAIVQRDASGNFSAGTITATLSGNATTATTATQVANSHSPGTYITGSAFNGSAAQTWAVDATTTATASKVVARDVNGDDYRRYGFADYFNMSHGVSGATGDTIFYSSTDNYIRKNNATGFRASLNVPTRTGGDASGTWSINVTGSAGSATTATTATTATNTTGGNVQGSYLGVQNTSGSTGYGLSLYNGSVAGQPTYGVMFAQTASFGTYGNVSADWATYFTMDATANRGWIFRDITNGNKASISNLGDMTLARSLGVGTAGSGTAGQIRATDSVVAFYSSDIKFKENIQNIPNAAATASAIGGKLFDWKDDYIEAQGGEDGYFVQKADFGVVAQDVQKHFPRAVRTRPNGSLAVDYEKLSALALAAISELTKRIEALEAKG